MSALITIAMNTFKNLIRDRILYNVLFIAFFLLAVGYWASLLVFGNQHRVMLHFGMMINTLAVMGIAISAGARIIAQETESRMLILILSRPVSRTQYWIGKWFGMGLFLFLNLVLLAGVLILGLYLTGGRPNFALGQALSLIWLEAWLMSAFSLWCSLLLSPALTMMTAAAFLFISHNQEQIQFLKSQDAPGASGLQVLSHFFPRADQWWMDTRVFYELPLSFSEWGTRFGYGLIWVFIFILIGNAFFYRKNIE